MLRPLLALVTLFAAALAAAAPAPPAAGLELHNRLAAPADGAPNAVALTLDACGGAFDRDLIRTLVEQQVPATVFVTKRWLDRNPAGAAALLAHPELFELEDHGTAHVPALIGAGQRIYGMAGEPDLPHLQAEVSGAAQAIRALTGRAPQFYRGAAAVYDRVAIEAIEAMGYRIAGFSVNADAGATLARTAIVARLRSVKPGDIVIAHMNKPAGQTAEALAAALPELKARGYRFITLSQALLQPA